MATFYAIQQMPLGVSKMILSSRPIFTLIFGRIFLGESLHRVDGVAVVLMLTGVLLVIQPWGEARDVEEGYNDHFYLAAALAFFATALASNIAIILR